MKRRSCRRGAAWGAAIVLAACAGGHWALVRPPEVDDPSYPKGVHLQREAPKSEWRPVATFASEKECQAALKASAADAIDAARRTHGDDAKYELSVRRAVSSACIMRDSAP